MCTSQRPATTIERHAARLTLSYIRCHFGVAKPCVCDNSIIQIHFSMQGGCGVRQALPTIGTVSQHLLGRSENTLGVYSGQRWLRVRLTRPKPIRRSHVTAACGVVVFRAFPTAASIRSLPRGPSRLIWTSSKSSLPKECSQDVCLCYLSGGFRSDNAGRMEDASRLGGILGKASTRWSDSLPVVPSCDRRHVNSRPCIGKV